MKKKHSIELIKKTTKLMKKNKIIPDASHSDIVDEDNEEEDHRDNLSQRITNDALSNSSILHFCARNCPVDKQTGQSSIGLSLPAEKNNQHEKKKKTAFRWGSL